MKSLLLALSLGLVSIGALADAENPTDKEFQFALEVFDNGPQKVLDYCNEGGAEALDSSTEDCVKFVYRGAANFFANYLVNAADDECKLTSSEVFKF